MKKLIIILALFLTYSCSLHQDRKNNGIVGYEKYNNKTVIYIDKLIKSKVPAVINKFYYNNLENRDYKKIENIVSSESNSCTIYLKSRFAKSGYLYINAKYLNKLNFNKDSILLMIDMDTINSKEYVLRFINLKRSNIQQVDTINDESVTVVKIKTHSSH